MVVAWRWCHAQAPQQQHLRTHHAPAMRRVRLCTLLATMHIVSCFCRVSRATNVSEEIKHTFSSAAPHVGVALKGGAEALVATDQGARTESPKLLGYIFDTHVNLKHHHHDHRWGPHFEEATNITNMTVQVSNTATLNCRISLLQDKTVSWVRRKNDDELELLTVGLHTYSGDSRYTIEFQYPNNWRLQIKYTNKRDEGLYECQISTHPPRVIQVNLHIKAPEVLIVDEHGRQLFEKYYKADSTIQLTCLVRHVAMTSSYVMWIHGNNTLNYDLTRGGISVKTDLMEEGANSSLAVARADKADSGNYTCSISATEFATVAVHVLNGENPAELHHGSDAGPQIRAPSPTVFCVLIVLSIVLPILR